MNRGWMFSVVTMLQLLLPQFGKSQDTILVSNERISYSVEESTNDSTIYILGVGGSPKKNVRDLMLETFVHLNGITADTVLMEWRRMVAIDSIGIFAKSIFDIAGFKLKCYKLEYYEIDSSIPFNTGALLKEFSSESNFLTHEMKSFLDMHSPDYIVFSDFIINNKKGERKFVQLLYESICVFGINTEW